MSSPAPPSETRRLIALRSHEIMDTVAEPAFERVVRLAARFFAMPMAAISFVDEFRVWCKATHGLSQHESAREASYCSHAILQKDVLVVHDTRMDARFNGPLFDVGPDSIRFYAGAALCTAEGHALGALCVMDTAPREFTQEDKDTLADMASLVMDEVSLRRLVVRLRAETADGRLTQRALNRQQHLVRRLSGSLEDRVRLRSEETLRVNESLRAEIVRRRRTDTALKLAKEEAERANLAKSEFLSRLSHELRTPLNAILGFGQILQGPLPAQEQHECASHVLTAGRHLLSLVNEVLDIACIEAGRIARSQEPVCVSEIVGEMLDLVRPLATARGLTLEISRVNEVGGIVLADRQRFKQALLNLLSNAVKYSPESRRIVVTCRIERARHLRLSVTDQGPGMTREQSGRLFVAFDRLGAEHSEVQGTGLGLSLSKRFIEAMGGTIGVTTAPGRGSTFWVRLPLSEPGSSVVRETSVTETYGARRSAAAKSLEPPRRRKTCPLPAHA